MYLVSIKFIAALPEGDKVVEISSPSGAGNTQYHLMVDKFYWGTIKHDMKGWCVAFQNPNFDYSMGDLQPLIDIVNTQTIV